MKQPTPGALATRRRAMMRYAIWLGLALLAASIVSRESLKADQVELQPLAAQVRRAAEPQAPRSKRGQSG